MINSNDVVILKAPLRIDFGGAVDIPEIASALFDEQPCTFNIAVSPGIALEIEACVRGINIVSDQSGSMTTSRSGVVPPLGSRFRIIFGALAKLGVDGVHVRIRLGRRPGSGLGGSGALTFALVYGIMVLRGEGSEEDAQFRMLCAIRARNIEHDLGESITGLQDQLAAAFGGMNLWHWRTEYPNEPVNQTALLVPDNMNEKILVCELPRGRSSATASQQFIDSLNSKFNREKWSHLNALTAIFANCVVQQDWAEACRISRAALALRESLLAREDMLSHPLVKKSLELCCAVGFGGGNVEGSLWAIGSKDDIRQLGNWVINSRKFGFNFLEVGIDPQGLRISKSTKNPD